MTSAHICRNPLATPRYIQHGDSGPTRQRRTAGRVPHTPSVFVAPVRSQRPCRAEERQAHRDGLGDAGRQCRRLGLATHGHVGNETRRPSERYLANETGHYQWNSPDGQVACFEPRRPGYWQSGNANGTSLVRPRDLMNPNDDDFTVPAGPVEQTTFAGRQAWRALLAPPRRKPQPVWQILDAESGVTLAYQSPDGRALVAFTSLATGIELPPDTFALPPADRQP